MSSFGRNYRVTTFGESHCKAVGVIIDGVPPRISLTETDIQPQLSRRRPGQSSISTKRNESDMAEILSGTEGGISLGTPVAVRVLNLDMRPQDYNFQEKQDSEKGNSGCCTSSSPTSLSPLSPEYVPRPSHADYTYYMKYGINASSGGGRASARETIGRVIAGAVAEKCLKTWFPDFRIVAWTSSVGPIEFDIREEKYGNLLQTITRDIVDETMSRCPDKVIAEKMEELILNLAKEGDSTGGTVSCACYGVPVGLGEPCFDKLEATLAHAMLSIPATKGFEIGSGFAGTKMKGSEHNDIFIKKGDHLGTVTNNSGGIQGGISNAEPIIFRVAFKPPATIGKAQHTTNLNGYEQVLAAKGRHDPCVVNRAVPIVEAMAAIVLMDAFLTQKTRT